MIILDAGSVTKFKFLVAFNFGWFDAIQLMSKDAKTLLSS